MVNTYCPPMVGPLPIDDTRPFLASTGPIDDGHAGFEAVSVAVRIEALVLCQQYVSVVGMMTDNRSDAIELVHWRGRFYVHNGHHRVLRAIIRGSKTIKARVMWAED